MDIIAWKDNGEGLKNPLLRLRMSKVREKVHRASQTCVSRKPLLVQHNMAKYTHTHVSTCTYAYTSCVCANVLQEIIINVSATGTWPIISKANRSSDVKLRCSMFNLLGGAIQNYVWSACN